MDEVDQEELLHSIEDHANAIEKKLVHMFSWEDTQEYDEIRAKYLHGSTAPIPTFDYEPLLA